MMKWFKDRLTYGPEGQGSAPAPTPAGDPAPSPVDLEFDPFEPGNEPGEEGAGASAPAPRPPESGQSEGGDALPPTPGQPAAQPPPHDPVNATLERLTELLSRQNQQPAQPAAQPAAPSGPRFSFQVPQTVLSAIGSEDPGERQQGLNQLVNGLANSMYAELQAEQIQREQLLLREVHRISQSTVGAQTEQQRIVSDFYGTYQDLGASPDLKRFVATTAQQLASELSAQGRPVGWTPEFKLALAQRVYGTLGKPMPGAQAPAPGPTPPARQPRRPQFAAGTSGSRGGSSAAPSPEVQDIWETFDLA